MRVPFWPFSRISYTMSSVLRLLDLSFEEYYRPAHQGAYISTLGLAVLKINRQIEQ